VPRLDAAWKIYFVRGRLTADILGIDRSLALGDAAILLRSCILDRPAKQFPVSFMPHWESAACGDWPAVCEQANIHYIDPCASVDTVLHEILASGVVVSEAMHGAIVADALRVPWIAVRPIRGRNRMKWMDWASALDLTLAPCAMGASNAWELCVSWLDGRPVWSQRLERRGRILRHPGRALFIARSARTLEKIAQLAPQLSADSAIERAHSAMLDKLENLKQDLGRRRFVSDVISA
jgi:succinoglycan biosynthesis protein ExoV